MDRSAPRVGRAALFFGFLKIGLLGFGGVAAWARRVIVEERAWLSEKDYATVLGIGQVLPGPNTCNAAVMIGDRFQGVVGSLLALAALMAMPLVILISLATVYERFQALPSVQAGIAGAAAAAAGMVVGTALKMARKLKPSGLQLAIGLVACLACGVLRLPLVAVVAVLAPLAFGAMMFVGRRR